jgi:membrane associated rhomboid family serine protease
MVIRYNAPVILTFALVAAIAMLITQFVGPGFMQSFFMVPGKYGGFNFFSVDFYKLVSHAIGHAGWDHLVGNFTFILLIGPILEEKYGSSNILFMMIVTALVTGIVNVLFFPTALLGASGIVFMLIVLISFTNIKGDEIPITLIVIILLFLAKEIIGMFQQNDISEAAHLIGGSFGGLFGFFFSKKARKEIT